MKINPILWKEFIFSEIFVIKKGFYNKKPEHTTIGSVPFLGAIDKNNGVSEYYSVADIDNASKTGKGKNSPLKDKIFPPHALCVTNNGSVGFAYYQKEEFTCSHDVNPLYILDGAFNEYTALFVSTVIQKEQYKWAYGRKWRPERMLESKIMLPALNNKPDWDYMERYIKTLKYKHLTTNFRENIRPKKVIYDEFKVSDIFNVKYGVNLELNNCQEVLSNSPKAVNFVSRSKENNGVTAYVEIIQNVKPQSAGLITVAGGGSSVLSTFVQKEPFYSGRDLLLLESIEPMSIYTKLYICTVIMANKYKYSFGRQANNTLGQIKLTLPATSKKKLNYNYIDRYIKSLPYSDRL